MNTHIRKTFNFTCKQGQHDDVFNILSEMYGKENCFKLTLDNGDITVSCILPEGVSKRSVDRLLYQFGVAGAVSRKNRYKIVKLDEAYFDTYKVEEAVGFGNTFVASVGGKLSKMHLRYVSYGCDCCGGYRELVSE